MSAIEITYRQVTDNDDITDVMRSFFEDEIMLNSYPINASEKQGYQKWLEKVKIVIPVQYYYGKLKFPIESIKHLSIYFFNNFFYRFL